MKTFDSLIFDMDGTLWDAVDSYATVWNNTLTSLGIHHHITRRELVDCMGLTLPVILERLIDPGQIDINHFLKELYINEEAMMPQLGGTLYPGVARGIGELSQKYRLFMVSNCSASGLDNFLSFTALKTYFADTLSNGETGLDKADNIGLLVERNRLQAPVYIGDTQGDSDQCRRAGVPFIHVTYGFGDCTDPFMQVDSFDALVKALI